MTLEDEWQSLEQMQALPFFLSWAWVKNWLECYNPKIFRVTVRKDQQTSAIGLFTLSIQKRHYFIRSRQLRLNQTGNPHEDQIWVEFNDVICHPDYTDEARDACLQALLSSDLPFDEIVFSMAVDETIKKIHENYPKALVTEYIPGYRTNFEGISDKSTFLDSLSSNTRYQVRRAIRLYEKQFGHVSINQASSIDEALNFFQQAGQFHLSRWHDSGFKNPDFVKFHEQLIQQTFYDQAVALLAVKAGETPIAFLYYQISNQTAWFYLQGVHSVSNAKLKPGLVAHSLANQFFMDRGLKAYDYMGGQSQYKDQLSEKNLELSTLTIQKPCLKFTIENQLKKLKSLISK